MNKCPKCKKLFLEGGVDDKGIYHKCIYCKKIYDVIDYKLIERKNYKKDKKKDIEC